MNNQKLNDQEQVRLSKLEALQKQKMNPYEITKVNRTHTTATFKKEFESGTKESLHECTTKVVLAGRIVGIRRTFMVLHDFFGRIQLYLNKNNHPEVFQYFNDYLDLGDVVHVEGTPMKTNTGELTLNVNKLVIVSKSLKTPPEKFHGIVDEEDRARKRYLDLVYNESSMEAFKLRTRIISLMRSYLDEQGFYEVETPVLQPILGGANAKPFITKYNALKQNFYLRIATEIPLKKLIVGGFEKVYEIGRIFRNEGMDATHNPEFTSIELYVAYGNMQTVMDITENVIRFIAQKINKLQITAHDKVIDLSKPFKKASMVDLIKEATGIDFKKVKDTNEAIALAKKHNVEFEKHQESYGHIVSLFFEKFCEDKLFEPTFVTGHPVDVSPLSKLDYSDPRFTERFELFINGKEFANAFSELNDPIDQRNRFEAQVLEKQKGNSEAVEVDYDFLEALEYALPPTGGLGIGIDRLVMLFCEKSSIRDVLLFPQMKSLK
ncbi:lysine--tRNA ligase [[Mycoplasma] testudinis]|uniref:lysine--tRNA ligase n=1 Tax=[Mycoplasma] testudinis TaxID=33924 RepID=UPI00056529B0|nr:lysine--tRNA ligase [[Mycoplasma] testudinis]